jgi:hypothetical protein
MNLTAWAVIAFVVLVIGVILAANWGEIVRYMKMRKM